MPAPQSNVTIQVQQIGQVLSDVLYHKLENSKKQVKAVLNIVIFVQITL